MANDTNLKPTMLDTNPEGLTVKERMFLKKLDKIVSLLEEIYGKMCGENPEHYEGEEEFHSDPRTLQQLIDNDDIPF